MRNANRRDRSRFQYKKRGKRMNLERVWQYIWAAKFDPPIDLETYRTLLFSSEHYWTERKWTLDLDWIIWESNVKSFIIQWLNRWSIVGLLAEFFQQRKGCVANAKMNCISLHWHCTIWLNLAGMKEKNLCYFVHPLCCCVVWLSF